MLIKNNFVDISVYFLLEKLRDWVLIIWKIPILNEKQYNKYLRNNNKKVKQQKVIYIYIYNILMFKTFNLLTLSIMIIFISR